MLMRYKECPEQPPPGSPAIAGDKVMHAKRLFGALAEGGQVRMPLGKTFFASAFGMVADRFGVGWMVIVPPAKP